MRTGRPIPQLSLTEAEREVLQNWVRRPKSAQALALRSRMILLCAAGETNTNVAMKLDVRIQTVCKWRQRFVGRRLDGLLDEPRPGTPRKVSDKDVERVLTMTLESPPKDATHWRALVRQPPNRTEPEHDQPHLARLCVAATSERIVQTVQGAAIYRNSSGYRGVVLEPSRSCVSAVRGREEPDSSAEPDAAPVTHAPWAGRATHARLYSARHNLTVRCFGCENRPSDRRVPSAAPEC